MTTLTRVPARTMAQAAGIAIVVYLVIGIPTDIVPNPIFGRSSIQVRWWDPPMLAATAALVGLILALRPGDLDDDEIDGNDKRAVAGGAVGLLAVGCPTCNHLVVLLLGTSGALSAFQPIQPVLGLASIGLLLYTLRRRLRDIDRTTCTVG